MIVLVSLTEFVSGSSGVYSGHDCRSDDGHVESV